MTQAASVTTTAKTSERTAASGSRLGLCIALVASVALGAIAVFMWLRCGARLMWPPLQDDAYYYYVVAHNFAHGRGLTMDGVLWTNGFQPLWFLIVLPIFACFAERTDTPLMIVQALSIGLYCTGVGMLGRVAVRIGVRRELAIAAALAALLAPFVAHTSGMEGVITLPLLILAISWLVERPQLLIARATPPSVGDCIGLGVLLGLLMLGRLDSVFSILTALAIVGISRLAMGGNWVTRVRRALRDGVLICLPLGLLVGPYLLWNLLNTGHLVPVSGALKSTFPHAHFQMRWIREFPHWLALLLPMLAWLAVLPLRRLPNAVEAAARWAILPAVIGSLLHAAYTLFFCKWAVHGWHFALYIPPALLCAGQLGHWLIDALPTREVVRRRLARLAPPAAGLLVVASIVVSVRKVIGENEFRAAAYDGAVWARENTPKDALFAMSDCGVFTYYSRRDCINLDGVINSWEFQETLAAGRLGEYLRERGVDYLVSHWVPQDFASHERLDRRFPARLYDGKSSTIPVERKDEVFRSATYEADDGDGFLAVWRLDP